MSFSEQRKKVANQNSGIVDKGIYSDYLKEERAVDWNRIKKTAVYTLWEDIANLNSMTFNLEEYLGNSPYQTACGYATDAMRVSIKPEYINGGKIKAWVKEALLCFDGILIHYIQETLGKPIVQLKKGQSFESDVYRTLQSIDGVDSEIGHSFGQVYQIRNEMEHVHVTNDEGKRILKRISNSKYNKKRDTILTLLKEGLDGLMGRLETKSSIEGS